MSSSDAFQQFRNLFAQNESKKFFRKSYNPHLKDIVNLEYVIGKGFKPEDLDHFSEIIFDNIRKPRYLKLVYHITNDNNEGNIELYSYDGNSKKLLFDVGDFSSTSVSYYCKLDNHINQLMLTIKTKDNFHIHQIEFIEISGWEYKVRKCQQYAIKLRNLLEKQPHLKRKLLQEIKNNGIKATVNKAKTKLYKNDFNTNVITHIEQKTVSMSIDRDSILVVSHDAHRGGAALLALNIVRNLTTIYRKNVYVILLQGGPNLNEFAKYAQVYNLHQSSLSSIESEKQISEVITQLKNVGVSRCIANTVVSGVLLKVLHKKGIKTISLIHELPTSIKTYNFVEGANYVRKYADKIVFPNQFVKNEFLKQFPLDDDEKITVSPQGIYSKAVIMNKQESKKLICENLGINEDVKLILGCGYGDLRKGIDKFLDIANEVVNEFRMNNVHFLWVGEADTLMEKWLLHDVEKMLLSNNFHRMGFVDDPNFLFAGADVFLLTSREDPFPSVVLNSLDNKTPVLAFEDAGGAAELIERIGGKNIPYLNVHLMAQETIRILENPEDYTQVVNTGKQIIDQEFDFNRYVQNLLVFLEDESEQTYKHLMLAKQKKFRVSVIVPNYNYEQFLQERLYSIIHQTYQPYEIIFLDDLSKDNSVEVARDILEKSGIRYKILTNDINNGCFKQWIKGIKEADGDLVWIAEADDKCELNLIESLIPFFDDQEVNLAYSQSQIIDEYSNIVNFEYTQYTSDLSKEKWCSPYCIDGQQEIVDGLSVKNTIPNASAVLLRKSALQGIDNFLNEFTICGDWMTYIYVLQKGKIAFYPQKLNYHRRHSQSIISVQEQSVNLYKEVIKVKQFILSKFNIPVFIRDKFLSHIETEYQRLGCKGYVDRNINNNSLLSEDYERLIQLTNNTIEATNYLQTRKKILFVAPDLEVGGGQMLVIRLANYFAPYQDVYIYNARPWLIDEQILRMISPKVKLLKSSGNPEELREYIEREKIDVVNSHIWWSDKIVYKALETANTVHWIISMHGCYEALLHNPDWDPEFSIYVESMLTRANKIIYATSKNTEIFNKVRIEADNKLHKIYYGYALQSIPEKSRKLLSIPEDSFVFGLISRAIKEKGWEESIKAVIELRKRFEKPHLILFGNSDYAKYLKEKYEEHNYVHFVTEFTEPSEWIGWLQMFDAALLPTYFVSESLPNSIIEYLAYNKPTIATDIGDIKHMIQSETLDKAAGILLPLNEDRTIEVDDILAAMEIMLTDKAKFNHFKQNTGLMFKQFEMSNFAASYYTLF